MDSEKVLSKLNAMTKNTLMATLKIQYTEVGKNYLVATMPVSPDVHQPMGLLHGGASVALAESVGSAASHAFVDTNKFEVRGIEITANHLKSKRGGVVTARAELIHKGRMIHLWEIKITDENNLLISLCKLTNIIMVK